MVAGLLFRKYFMTVLELNIIITFAVKSNEKGNLNEVYIISSSVVM